MYILPQILSITTKNELINDILCKFKEKLSNAIETFTNDFSKDRYLNTMIYLQSLSNTFNTVFLIHYFESLDEQFKNSKERKERYHINKSNVSRTYITIFGELTFKRTLYKDKITKEYYFYLDDILNLEAYKNYDPIVRAILVNDSVITSPNNASFNSSLNVLDLKNLLNNNVPLIPRQTIYRFKQEIKVRDINYSIIPNGKTLYTMVDEKWLHEQDKDKPGKKWIMAKCFVFFTGIERKGKRSRLVGRHVFITTSKTPWKDCANEIYKIYDFEKVETINLLSDAGSWILSGASELRFHTNNKIVVNTCEFHVKQKINRSTTDKDLRITIANIIYNNEDKQAFIEEMDKLINNAEKDSRKQKIEEYKNYILRHWKGIINMKYSLCKSSMEAHIQHCIACIFSSVPKAYSKDNIENYLKLQEMKLNGINIFKYYLDTYNTNEEYIYNEEKKVNFSIFEKSTSNMPILRSASHSAKALYCLAHPI